MKDNQTNQTISLSDIPEPTTLEQFHENLSQFFLTDSNGKLKVKGHKDIPVKELKSVQDIADILLSNGVKDTDDRMVSISGASLCPTIEFSDDDQLTIYNGQKEFLKTVREPKWFHIGSEKLFFFCSQVIGKYMTREGAENNNHFRPITDE